jgi:hypothetical protein
MRGARGSDQAHDAFAVPRGNYASCACVENVSVV